MKLLHCLFIFTFFYLARFFDEVSKVSSYSCFGIDETLKALEAGTVETLIVWESFDGKHYFLSHDPRAEMKTIDSEWEHIEEMSLLEWFFKNDQKFSKR